MADGNESITSALKTDYLVLEGKEPEAMTSKRRIKHQRNKTSFFN